MHPIHAISVGGLHQRPGQRWRFSLCRTLGRTLVLAILAAVSCGRAWAAPAAVSAAPRPDDACVGTGDLFAAHPKFNAQSPPVVCLINTQEIAELRQQAATPEGLKKARQLKSRIEELSGLPCLVVHYTQIMRRELDRPNVKAIVLTAWKKMQDERHAGEIAGLIRETSRPLIAFCGGHHQIYLAYGGRSDIMRRLRPGETDPYPKYMPGLYKEWGWVKVRIVRRDPLLAGLPDEMLLPERHYAQCVSLPPDFELLASSAECRVQAIKHKTRPVYGTQFHPEIYDWAHPHGRILLANFFRIAGIDVERTVPAHLAALRVKAAAGLEGLFTPPAQLRAQDRPIVCAVDLENPDLIRSRVSKDAGRGYRDKLAKFGARMQELSGLPCLIVHYTQVSRRDFANPAIRAVVLMGHAGARIEPLSAEIVAVIRDTAIPIIGLCGGHQLIGEAFGGPVERMRRLKPGEKDPNPNYWPGFFKEWAFLPVRIVQRDPLFDGLGDRPLLREYHSAEIKSLPDEFLLLASTDECRVQAIKHRGRILYGTQFHPEIHDAEHPDGKTVLKNFFRIAGVTAPGGAQPGSGGGHQPSQK
jgi:GMP synthase (glutamine-hydrolysing)